TSLSSTEGGSESYRGDATINIPIVEGKLAARATVGYGDLGGWIDNLVKSDINDMQLTNVRLKVNAQPTDEFSLGLSYWHSNTDVGANPLSGDDNVYPGVLDAPSVNRFDAVGLKVGYEFSAFSLDRKSVV